MEKTQAKWYVLNVYSGLENSVVEAIKDGAAKKNMLELFEEFFIPSEQVMEIKRGAKVTTNKKYFPGYILMKVIMNDDLWSFVCSVPKVRGFLGSKKPSPVPFSEVEKVFKQVKESIEKPRNVIKFEVGELVTVIEGPFSSFTGTIEEVDTVHERLTVSVMIFGRPTPIEIEYNQVEKAK